MCICFSSSSSQIQWYLTIICFYLERKEEFLRKCIPLCLSQYRLYLSCISPNSRRNFFGHRNFLQASPHRSLSSRNSSVERSLSCSRDLSVCLMFFFSLFVTHTLCVCSRLVTRYSLSLCVVLLQLPYFATSISVSVFTHTHPY